MEKYILNENIMKVSNKNIYPICYMEMATVEFMKKNIQFTR
jgi:hypothetical protein